MGPRTCKVFSLFPHLKSIQLVRLSQMFGHRSICRADCVWKLVTANCLPFRHINCLQGGSPYHALNCLPNMSGSNTNKSAVDPCKKLKVTRPMRTRHLSRDSTCSGGTTLKSENVELRNLADGDLFQDQTKQEVARKDSIVVESEGLCLGIRPSMRADTNYKKSQCERKDLELPQSLIDNKLSQSWSDENSSQVYGAVHKMEKQVENSMEDAKICAHMISKEWSHTKIIEVDAALLRFVKGKGGSTQKLIEEDFAVRIIFPSSKDENKIVIEAASDENIMKASEKIQAILAEAVESRSLDYSHFISLPLAIHSELVEKLTAFQNSVLGTPKLNQEIELNTDLAKDAADDVKIEDNRSVSGVDFDCQLQSQENDEKAKVTKVVETYYPPKAHRSFDLSGLRIDQSIFIKPKTFHLTVLMLKLWNNERVNAAAEVLKNIASRVNDALGDQPVTIRMKGLDCMKGSLAKARVLYAPVEEIGGKDRLLRACQVIIDAYTEAGLLMEKDSKQKLKLYNFMPWGTKLHATIMNARHRKRSFKSRRKDDCFDARTIFQQYGSYEWGDFQIREAHLSQRFVFDESGYYHCCASIPFPQD